MEEALKQGYAKSKKTENKSEKPEEPRENHKIKLRGEALVVPKGAFGVLKRLLICVCAPQFLVV